MAPWNTVGDSVLGKKSFIGSMLNLGRVREDPKDLPRFKKKQPKDCMQITQTDHGPF